MPSRIWVPLLCPLQRGNTPGRLTACPQDVCFHSPFPSAGSLPPSVSSTPAHPMAMAFASTFLCSQEIHRLAPMVDAHLLHREKSRDGSARARRLCWACKAVRLFQMCDRSRVGNKTAGSCEACACPSWWGKAWTQLALFQMSLLTWPQPPRPLTRPGPQAVPGRARRG